jgi:sulfite exporter TauE/SafE
MVKSAANRRTEMTIPNGFVRSAVAVSTGATVVGATATLIWGLGAVVLWWMPGMAPAATGRADADPHTVLIRLLVGMMVIAALVLAHRLGGLVWTVLGAIGEIALRKAGVTVGREPEEQ